MQDENTTATSKKNTKQELMEWIRALVIALVISLFITQVVIVNAQVPTGSMENTINVGDRLLGNRLAYLFAAPNRGDIIIFPAPDDETQLYVKRIIGLPGEKIYIENGHIYVNDDPLPIEDAHQSSPMLETYGPYFVPEDSYFVLGDNRSNSLDSRAWINPFVERGKIIGKAFIRIFPSPALLK